MKKINYTSTETYYAAGRSIEDARNRAQDDQISPTPADAWNTLDYFDREEHLNGFEVFEFQVTEKITKVDPPYSKVDLT